MNGATSPHRSSMHSDYFSDHSMACRLERAEATANARFVEAHAQLEPDLGAHWIEVAGAYAMFDGARSPCTQTFALGMFRMPTNSELDEIETFFKDRHAPIFHEVSPLAEKGLLPLLNERAYQPMEFTTVMFLPLDVRRSSEATGTDFMEVRVIGQEEGDLWARTAVEGWQAEAESAEFADLMFSLMRTNASRAGCICFLAESRGKPIATGALAIHDGVALLAGASTLPEARRQGAQKALLEARLRYAIDSGCDLAMLCAAPGSASQRNGERQGFRIAYTRVKFQLKLGPVV
jgi:GNAT superfamily N-acetyltransferase